MRRFIFVVNKIAMIDFDSSITEEFFLDNNLVKNLLQNVLLSSTFRIYSFATSLLFQAARVCVLRSLSLTHAQVRTKVESGTKRLTCLPETLVEPPT